MRSVVAFAACAVVAAVVVPKYAAQIHDHPSTPTMMAARSDTPAAHSTANSREVVISPSANGHFQVEGRIDGRPMNFMVDTGASMVALTERDAAALGIHPAANDYTAQVRTANGTVRAAPVEISMIEIDDIEVHNVAAIVLPANALSDNLLGLTFLTRLRHFEYASGRLVLEQ
jgi:aspartyl protease family protein